MNIKTGKQNRFSSISTSLKMLNIAKAIYALFASLGKKINQSFNPNFEIQLV